MRIYNVTSTLKLRSVLAHFGPFDSYAVDGKDIELFKTEHCDICAVHLKGANPVTIVKARKFVLEHLKLSTRLLEAPSYFDEVGCDDEGNCVCPSCYEEGEVNKKMCEVEGGV